LNRSRAQTIARWLTLATAFLILYGSLYPFRFAGLGELGLVELIGSLRFQPTSRGDAVANVLLYMPLGLCVVLACPVGWRRTTALAAAVILGSLLSVGVEALQVHTDGRVSSLTDVVINAAGAVVGGLGGLSYLAIGTTLRIPGVAAGRPAPVPSGLIVLWLAFRLAPFVPTIDWQKYKDAVKPLFLEPQLDFLGTFRYFVGWLVVSYAVRQIWQRGHAVYALLGIVSIVLAGRVVIVGKSLVASEVAALALCFPVAARLHTGQGRRGTLILTVLLMWTILLQGLAPFEFSAHAQPFSWIPFANALGESTEANYSALLEKCFWYSSLVWLLTVCGMRIGGAVLATASLVAAIELVQVWVPGRTADITDPLLAIAAGGILALARPQPSAAVPHRANR
jgi:VanZ family protein